MNFKAGDLINSFRQQLGSSYSEGELSQILFLAFEHVLGFSKTDLVLKRDQLLTKEQSDKLNDIIQRLLKQEPIQYIIGSTEFYGLPIKVNQNVLIPRQETEELVDLIIKESKSLPSSKPINILDICTGSGCIAIVLKKHIPQANVNAIDISNEALEVAKENAALNNTPIEFIQDDIFNLKSHPARAGSNPKSHFDIIVSNPPYVMKSEMKTMQSQVLLHEPHLALFVEDENPLIYYQAITEFAIKNLKRGGCLYFEVNKFTAEDLLKYLKQKKIKSVDLIMDLNKNNRMVRCIY